jgi:hypothetical protein
MNTPASPPRPARQSRHADGRFGGFHADPTLSLQPLAGAIDQATSSVFFAIAFLGQTSISDLVRAAVDRLTSKSVFSYGISDKKGGLAVQKPDGTEGIISWAYLKANAPQPFTAEFSSGAGIHEHNKFVVTDFNLPTAKVFTSSSNMTESGEKGNGDHLIMIEDPRVATSSSRPSSSSTTSTSPLKSVRSRSRQRSHSRSQSQSPKPRRPGLPPFISRTVSIIVSGSIPPSGISPRNRQSAKPLNPVSTKSQEGHRSAARCSGKESD